MKQRGRKSPADLTMTVIDGGFGKGVKPAPDHLTDRQKEIWRGVQSSESPGLFDSDAMRQMLEDYCRHREAIEKICEVVNQFEPAWLKNSEGAKRYKDLLRMREVEITGAARLARNMRLTNQARYTPQRAATAWQNRPVGPKPWEE